MVSTEASFVVQLKGTITKKRYKCAIIFVDHFSILRFVQLQLDDSVVETLAAEHLRPSPPTMVSASSTTTVIMNVSLTMPSVKLATTAANVYPSAA